MSFENQRDGKKYRSTCSLGSFCSVTVLSIWLVLCKQSYVHRVGVPDFVSIIGKSPLILSVFLHFSSLFIWGFFHWWVFYCASQSCLLLRGILLLLLCSLLSSYTNSLNIKGKRINAHNKNPQVHWDDRTSRAEKEWGDGIRGLSMSAARYALFRLDESPPHTKNWRPQLLAFVNVQKNDEEENYTLRHTRLFNFLYQLKAGRSQTMEISWLMDWSIPIGRGFVVAASILEGDYLEKHRHVEPVRAVSDRYSFSSDVSQRYFITIAATSIGSCSSESSRFCWSFNCQRHWRWHQRIVISLNEFYPCKTSWSFSRIQTEGLGGLRPNTIVLCWPSHWKKDFDSYTADSFIRRSSSILIASVIPSFLSIGTINIAEARHCALIVPKNIDNFPDNKEIQEGTIDIWWIIHDGGLLFLVAFLLKRHKVWSRCRLRLFTVAQLEDNSVEMKKDLEQYMYQLRIEAEVDVVEMVRAWSVRSLMKSIRDVCLGWSRNLCLCLRTNVEIGRTNETVERPEISGQRNAITGKVKRMCQWDGIECLYLTWFLVALSHL